MAGMKVHSFGIVILWLFSLAFAGSVGMTLIILACALPEYRERLLNRAINNLPVVFPLQLFLKFKFFKIPINWVWWPFIVVLFYLLAPVPTLLARRYTERTGSPNSSMDVAIFITMFFVVSSFALPVILARSPPGSPAIQWGACYLTLTGNVVVYLTYIGFFVSLYQDYSDYSMW